MRATRARTNAARRAAFLRALAQTGNQTLAAERAGVSRSWVLVHRRAEPAFRARVEAAIAGARERLAEADAAPKALAWRQQHGQELLIGTGTDRGHMQIGRARPRQWTPNAEARFLRVLGATCNVTMACARVGLSRASAYLHRTRWPGFGERWDRTMMAGYPRVEKALAEGVELDLDAIDNGPGAPVPPASRDRQARLLGMHQRRVLRIRAQAARAGSGEEVGGDGPGGTHG